jgi:hypothetical protein
LSIPINKGGSRWKILIHFLLALKNYHFLAMCFN